MQLKAPFPYFGGKSRIAGAVWERFGDVPNYVEPFCGSLAMVLGRPTPPGIETVNDKDAFVTNFWRALAADPERVAHYADWPVNEVDLYARHCWLVERRVGLTDRLRADPAAYDPQIAGWWVWGISCWIGRGWCKEGREPSVRKRPYLTYWGSGVHQQLPHLGDGGVGVHRQLPHLGDGGRGVHRQAGGLAAWFGALADRLRHVRVTCGDFERVLTDAVTVTNGVTGVFLDPPYAPSNRDPEIYAVEDHTVAGRTHAWALAHGHDPRLRIALCGYEGDYQLPPGWTELAWKATGGYGNQGGRGNQFRERIYFSPHCLTSAQPRLFT